MPRILILDGNSLANRAFYALPMLTTTDGRPTNVLHGFMTMLLRLQKEQKPDYWVVAFDKSKATVRIEQYADYKGQRKETPAELRPQFGYLKEVLQEFAVPILELEGYEADDLIGTVARRAEQEEMEVQIYTGDRDALQLISPYTKVYLTKKGISEVEYYDEQALYERYQLRPEQIVDLKGLMGDSSDNIPGIPGVGEKTALKLLWEFGSVESCLENWSKVSGKKLQNSLVEYADQARLSRKLAQILCDAPVSFELHELVYRKPEEERVLNVLAKYNLRSVTRIWQERMNQESKECATGQSSGYEFKKSQKKPLTDKPLNEEITLNDEVGANIQEWPYHALTEGEWEEKIEEFAREKCILTLAYRLSEKDPHQSIWTEFAIAVSERTYSLVRSELSPSLIERWNSLLADPQVPKILGDSKSLASALLNEGRVLAGVCLDLSLAAYLVNSARSKFSSFDLAKDYFPSLEGFADLREEGAALAQVEKLFARQVAELELSSLLHDMEEPLALLLAQMEQNGISIDSVKLKEFGEALTTELTQLEQDIHEMAGESFNLNSPSQLGHILFDKLKLPPLKKTKTGYSTDAETLEELRPLHPMIDKLLDYRQLSKLMSTYVNGLLAQVREGKIHTTFQQTVATTGRLSSTEPNLQNIPIRLEQGRLLRKVFLPNQPGWVLFSADYSQIELRILAHYSQDPLLCESFALKQDVHARTAAEVFDIPLSEVTSDMRRKAKAVNFGLVYGLTDFGLSRDLGIPRKEAKFYVDQYFARYSGVQRYLAEIVLEAKEAGEVRTLLNRLRRIPELRSANRVQRQFGERIAMNTPVQGTAADIMKLAMLSVDRGLKEMGSKANILLQVHDELVLEVPPEEVNTVGNMVKERMEKAYLLSVPLTVETKAGPNWYDMSPLSLY